MWYSYAAVCTQACLFKSLKWLRRLFRLLKSAISLSDFYNYMAWVLHCWMRCRSIGIDFKSACHLLVATCLQDVVPVVIETLKRKCRHSDDVRWSQWRIFGALTFLYYWPEQSMCRWFETLSSLNNRVFFQIVICYLISFPTNVIQSSAVITRSDSCRWVSAKKDVTRMQPHWSYVFFCINPSICSAQYRWFYVIYFIKTYWARMIQQPRFVSTWGRATYNKNNM